MILKKWNYKLEEYEEFESPADNPALFESNLSAIRDCASCGDSLEYGQMYTSLEIHNNWGLGYGVCGECYQLELLKRDAEDGE